MIHLNGSSRWRKWRNEWFLKSGMIIWIDHLDALHRWSSWMKMVDGENKQPPQWMSSFFLTANIYTLMWTL